jgi:hypothetical protein
MIGNDTPTRPNQIPLPTTSPEFQDAHLVPRCQGLTHPRCAACGSSHPGPCCAGTPS